MSCGAFMTCPSGLGRRLPHLTRDQSATQTSSQGRCCVYGDVRRASWLARLTAIHPSDAPLPCSDLHQTQVTRTTKCAIQMILSMHCERCHATACWGTGNESVRWRTHWISCPATGKSAQKSGRRMAANGDQYWLHCSPSCPPLTSEFDGVHVEDKPAADLDIRKVSSFKLHAAHVLRCG